MSVVPIDSREYRLRLEQTYRRSVRACADRERLADIATAARAELEDLDRRLGDLGGRDGSAIDRLATRLELTPAHVEFLWAAVACSVDGRIVPHLEALGGHHARRGLSTAVYAALCSLDGWAAAELAEWLVSDNPLVRCGLITAAEDVSPAARAYLAAPRLISYLSGADRSISPLRVVSTSSELLHDANQADRIAELRAILGRDRNAVIVVEGPRGSGRVTATRCGATTDLVVLDAAKVDPATLSEALMSLRREVVLCSALPVLANPDHLLSEERPERRVALGRFVDDFDGQIVLTVTVPGCDLGTDRPLVRLPWRVADTEVRAQLWSRAARSTGAEVVSDLGPLAQRYRVGPAAIRRAIASTRMVAPEGVALDGAALAVGLRHNIAERLGGLAQRIEVTQTWDDLVVGEDTRDQIAALVGRIRYAHKVLEDWGYRQKIARGTGAAALFTGPPGTGKTMVAGLVARELDLELYQVDLSKVVSKWVGETEKNLARIFDAAEEGHALLLFDEADALFGQRSADTKSAVDRYANLEVNYLLQRVEAFGGITILTTNLETAIDSALKRRLASHIVFAAPDEDERTRLWERQATTGQAPLSKEVDHDALARLFPTMSGANIRNAAIAAAFLAAGDGASEITQDYLVRAGRVEYRSMGHMVADPGLASRSQRGRL